MNFNDKESIESKIKVMARLGRADLLFFMRNILGYDWVNEIEHRELCDFLMGDAVRGGKKRKKFSVVAAPRDTLKSTICSQGYPLWRMVRGDVDLRVLLDGENRDLSQARLSGIQHKLETSLMFGKCYGDWNGRKEGYKWNEEEATVSVRKSTSIREASFETSGVDVVKNSRHYDIIIPDDCHSDKNSRARDQIQKVIDHYKVLQPMLEPNGEFLIVCTWWDDKDANRWFIEMMGADVSVFLRTCYLDSKRTKPRYPVRLPIATLALKKKIMGPRLFGLQYLLECISEDDALFREEDLQLAPAKEIPKNLRRYLLVDPAGDPTAINSARRDSDNWAIAVVAVSPTGMLYLLDLALGLFNPTEGVEEIIKMIVAYNPHVVGIEKSGLGNTAFFVREKLRQMGRLAIVEDLKPSGRSKVERVSGLEPYVRMRRFKISSDCPFREEVIEEFVKFTRYGSKAKHDDAIDACAYALDMIQKYGVAVDDSVRNQELGRAEDLMYLNPSSKKHWEAYHKKASEVDSENWLGEFV